MLITLRQSSFWTDFNIQPTTKTFAPSSAIPVGHRAVFVHASTVDSGTDWTNTGLGGWGGICAWGTDSLGHTWNRDYYSPIDGFDQHVTVEIWSTAVTTQIPTGGVTAALTPASRGLSANWFLFDIDPQGAGVPTLDQVASSTVGSTFFGNTVATGTTAATTSAVEAAIGVVGIGAASGVFTVPAPFTKAAEYSGSQDGSARAICVGTRVTSATGTQGFTATLGSNSSFGVGVIATYKAAGAAAADPVAPVRVRLQAVNTAAGW